MGSKGGRGVRVAVRVGGWVSKGGRGVRVAVRMGGWVSKGGSKGVVEIC